MEINQNCRICLEQHALLDWNEEILDFCGTTYKDCYYKYTQLHDQVPDPFSQVLCENCSTELRNAHFLIQKAIESYQVLQQTSASSLINTTKLEYDTYKDHGDPPDFEIILFEQSTKSSIEDDDKKIISMVDTSMETPKQLKKEHINKKSKVQKMKLEKLDNFPAELGEHMNIPQSPLNVSSIISQDEVKESSKKVKKKSRMCAYCSKVIAAEYIKKHEETHKVHRERTEMCPKCGLKLYNKTGLYQHMLTHKENREKKYKCEFCNKAYFNRGTLTVHQRRHLGQMIPCTICPKQYCRQSELDKHMTTHSATPIHINVKKNKSKYYVECKECGKSMRSEQFKEHQAVHLNKPVVKCNICDKDFFSLSKCSKHMGRVHKKTRNECTTYYEGNNDGRRIPHLMLMQQEKIQPLFK